MAKKNNKDKKVEIINYNLDIRQINRTTQDIAKWRNAIQTAESIVFPRRYILYDLYSDILLDAHLSALIEKRLNAIINSPLIFSIDGEVDEIITNLFKTEKGIFLLRQILLSKFWGHSLVQFDFQDNSLVPYLIPRKNVVPEKGWIIRSQSETTPFIQYRDKPFSNWLLEIGDADDLGILMKAAQYVIYKRGGFGDWAQYSEIFGMPFRVGKYDAQDSETRLKLERALEEAGSAAWAVIPRESEIEFLTSNSQSGSKDIYKELINSCNAEMSKMILGNTLTTEQGDKGAKALGSIHMEVENQIHFADMIFLLNVLNEKLKPLLEMHGFPVGKGLFKFKETDNIDEKDHLEMDIKLAEQVPISDDYFYETYNIPKPDNYEELKEQKLINQQALQPPSGVSELSFFDKLKNFFVKAP